MRKTETDRQLHNRRVLLGFLCSVSLCALFLTFLPVSGEERIYGDVIRVHVLAASDSESDQQNKRQVMDALQTQFPVWLDGCETKEQTAERLNASTEQIAACAEAVLRSRGCDDAVTVSLEPYGYDRRETEGLRFPSGEYLSLRVLIGEGKGRNVLSVLFPEVSCFIASDEGGEALSAAECRLVSEENITVKFRILEVLESVFRNFP